LEGDSGRERELASSTMKLWQVLLLAGYSIAMSVGQLLFKQAAMTIELDRTSRPFLQVAATNIYLVSAVALYIALAALWVYILTVTELSKAYPFVALAFVFTPLLASKVFGESLNRSFYVGLAAIVFGLLVIGLGNRAP
jgi:drug/metabolite transporter (DMT)-like permease